jgi:hypothetical protein
MSDGPHLILAAFWLDEPDTDAVAEAVRVADFPVPEGSR